MKFKKEKILTSIFLTQVFCYSAGSFALEIDEKLTLRFLKVSDSKKTVLINRGSEDGLVVGDHAKFFITQGVVGRGVVEKVSPSRSIWAIYRLVDPNEIAEGRVLNLKIATPIKLTEDPSKSLKDEGEIAGADRINIPLAEGADDAPKALSSDEKDEMKSMTENMNADKKTDNGSVYASSKKLKDDEAFFQTPSLVQKNWEVYTSLFVSSLTGTQDDPSLDSTSSKNTTTEIALGGEKYFPTSTSFLKNLSAGAFIRLRNNSTSNSAGLTYKNTEYGMQANYHVFESPFATQKLIGYLSLSAGLGSMTLTSTTVSTTTTVEDTMTGSSMFFSLGAGVKTNITRNWTGRLSLEYYSTSASLAKDGASEKVKVSQAGPRFNVGLGYAF